MPSKTTRGAANGEGAATGGRQNVTLDRGLDILELFLDETEPLTMSEICVRLGLPQSSAYRIVRTMRDREWLTIDQLGVCRIGPRLLGLTSRAESHNVMLTAGDRILRELTEHTRETSLLTVVRSGYAVCLLRIEGPQAIRVSFQPGALHPLHAGASSTALLAFSGAEVIDRVCASTLARYSDQTITDPEKLRKVLAGIERDGFAYSNGELDEGVSAVGAPVIPVEGKPAVAAVSVAAPAARLPRRRSGWTVDVVRAAADELAAAIRASG
jgi:DNA-binding IclR family transcriptional regulator